MSRLVLFRLRLAILGAVMLGVAITSVKADLRLTISLPKTRYLVDEPLYLKVAVKNTGDSDLPVVLILHPGSDFLSFTITRPGEQPRKYRDPMQFALTDITANMLAPGQEYTSTVNLTCEASRSKTRRLPTVLSRPGEYTIRATYTIGSNLPTPPLNVTSNELKLTVFEPTGLDRKAYEILRRRPLFPEHGPWGALDGYRCSYEELLRRYPNSRYAPHTRYRLAGIHTMHCSESERQTCEGRSRARLAARLYANAARQTDDALFGLLALRSAGRSEAMAGNSTEGRRLLEKAFLFPNATDGDRREALCHLQSLREGYWAMGRSSDPTVIPVYLPLRQFVRALGLSVEWQSSAKTARISGQGVSAELSAISGKAVINGKASQSPGIRLRAGRMGVSPRLMLDVMDARFRVAKADATTDDESGLCVPIDSMPAWSPGGTKIAFVSTRNGPGGSPDGPENIWVVNSDGSNMRQLTFDGNNTCPSWSPDGSKIAFQAGAQIWLVDVNTGAVTESTKGARGGFDPDWHPSDAAKLLCWAKASGGDNDLFLLNPATCRTDASGRRVLATREGTDMCPRWSPDGSRVAFVGEVKHSGGEEPTWHLMTMSSDGMDVQVRCPASQWTGRLAWFADGQKVLIDGGKVCDLTTGNVTTLFDGHLAEPDISRDGARVAYAAWQGSSGQFIFKRNMDGTGLTQVTQP